MTKLVKLYSIIENSRENSGDWYLFHAGDKYDVVAKKTRKLFRFSIKFIIFA
jgi:hypothetical protein